MDLLAAYQPRALAYASYTASVGSPVSTPSMVSCQVGGSASPDKRHGKDAKGAAAA